MYTWYLEKPTAVPLVLTTGTPTPLLMIYLVFSWLRTWSSGLITWSAATKRSLARWCSQFTLSSGYKLIQLLLPRDRVTVANQRTQPICETYAAPFNE